MHDPREPFANPITASGAQAAPPLDTLAALVIDTAIRLGVKHWVVSPGSRSAPLTAAIAQRRDVSAYVLYDERSAAYVALGIAQQTRTPVGLVCTSGTATLNYAPAIAEAFYQSVPLFVITADRPPEWVDQQDNQAIHQNGIYGAHVRASFTLPVDDGNPETRWHAIRTVTDAWQRATALPPGPVHINAPLREPLYAAAPQAIVRPQQVATAAYASPGLAETEWDAIASAWTRSERILIIGGPHPPDRDLAEALRGLTINPAVVVLGDITANLDASTGALRRWDVALGTGDATTLDALAPDLVVNFGGAITARGLKALLRKRPPRNDWRVAPGLPAPDTYQALTRVFPLRPADFFTALARKTAAQPLPLLDYAQRWRSLTDHADGTLDNFLDDSPFGEFAAVRALLATLPEGAILQIGNSMPIRYANFLGVQPGHLPAGVFANRGVSGIDGCVSTAVGAALAQPDVLTVLIVGDLAFFYDRNGLWHRHLPDNLRIAILNNHGGGIFDIIDGPDTLPEAVRRDFFLTPQPLTARRTAADHRLEYFHAPNAATLEEAIPYFFAPADCAVILEVETDMATNSAVYRAFRARMAALTLA